MDEAVEALLVGRHHCAVVLRQCVGKEEAEHSAFAVADHQIAHIYVNDPTILNEVRSLVEKVPGVEKLLGVIEKREADDNDGVAVMPGAADLLKSIPEGSWCVVTSGTRYLATSRLRFFHLPIPRVLVAADDVRKGKPDPEPYLRGAELLKVKPAECLVIEDAPAGIRSAHV